MDPGAQYFDINGTVAVVGNNCTVLNTISINNNNSLNYSMLTMTKEGELLSALPQSPRWYNNGDIIETDWNFLFMSFSWLISFISSYAVVRLLDHETWRTDKQKEHATAFIIRHSKEVSSIIFGYGAIWSMHFVGVSAVHPLHVDSCPNWPHAIGISLFCAVFFVWLAFFIVNKYDCFAGPDRLEVLKKILQKDRRVTDKKHRKRAQFAIHVTAFFHQPQYVVIGGIMAAVGALLMHYTGTSATLGPFKVEYRTATVCLSVVVAIVICQVGFFIIFRILHWKVEEFWLRPVSAAIIATAVNSLHYIGQSGMLYIFDSDKDYNCTVGEVGTWTSLQTAVVSVCLTTPCIAFYVEHVINQDLLLAYVELKNPSLDVPTSLSKQKSDDMIKRRKSNLSSMNRFSIALDEIEVEPDDIDDELDYDIRAKLTNQSISCYKMEELFTQEEEWIDEEVPSSFSSTHTRN